MKMSNKIKKSLAIATVLTLSIGQAMADGVTGINAANTTLRQYIGPVQTVCLAIGGIVGIIGGILIYIKWNSGDKDINKELMGWGGACLFLVLTPVLIKAFFGL